MRAVSAAEELSRSELEAAELGFSQLLRRRGMSPGFIERNRADLLARARLEYSRHLAAGDQIRNPVGWLINCAWRRTQNFLQSEHDSPAVVSIDDGGAFEDRAAATPEQEALDSDRHSRLQDAVDRLPLEERKVIELTYFEGFSIRQVAKLLDWDKSKAARRHGAALKRLQILLGVEDADSLAIEIGLAAWISIATERGGAIHLPAGFEAAAESASRGLSGLIARGHEVTRRLLSGGAAEPGVGTAASGAARTAGVCGAAALACMASGVVGPGVGGLIASHHAKTPPPHRRSADRTPAVVPTIYTQPAPSATAAGTPGNGAGSGGKQQASVAKNSAGNTDSTSSEARQVEKQFSPFASSEGTSISSGSSGAVTSSEGSAASSPTSQHSSPSSAERQASAEFGAFK
jgi:RNA polymerase sigma factor (sigma-70 family)